MQDTGEYTWRQAFARGVLASSAMLGGVLLLIGLLLAAQSNVPTMYADPIEPPDGWPKLSTSIKTVTPTLTHTGDEVLSYTIEIRNTGAYTAGATNLTDMLPAEVNYRGDASASDGVLSYSNGTLTWDGDVGFDSTVVVSFSVTLDTAFSGTVRNTAVISHPMIGHAVSATAETVVTDVPILAIAKSSEPAKPGANKPMTYTLTVTNLGQPGEMDLTVTDQIPGNTTLDEVGDDGGKTGNKVTWTRHVTLDQSASTVFTFSVQVGNVPSGTVIANDNYQVSSDLTPVQAGEPYTVTVIDPVFALFKHTWPDPPGSNRELTYTLTLLNKGSLATGLLISDRVPSGVTYRRGGSRDGNTVSWSLPQLDTGETASFTYTVHVGDVISVPIVNDDYAVCSAEGVCQPGEVLTSIVRGPTFEAMVTLDPIAKKPGGGTGPVTPTLVVRNLGPGNALDATAWFEFRRISVNANDFYADPAIGTLPPFPEFDCGEKCNSFVWVGDLGYGETITFTTLVGQSTQGGEEGTNYTATVVITDDLGSRVTDPVTGTASGKITHFANLIPYKSAPPVIGRGQLLTYTIRVWNSALSTDVPPAPVLTDVVPMSTTLVHVSHAGQSYPVSDSEVISWSLPALSTGEWLTRSFTVRVGGNVVSGTKLVNADYGLTWHEAETATVFSNVGLPVTTTVAEVGLIDSYKEVTPALALPGPDNVLTYTLHIVNSGPLPLSNVVVKDLLPWQSATYQRDAVASAGEVVSDIVSVHWEGDVAPFSSEVVTLTVLVDPDYEGAITNTAVITHPGLLKEVEVYAVAYVTEEPVLRIYKSAAPNPAVKGKELAYAIRVDNLGQQATGLVITDTIPVDTQYVPDSATGNGQLDDDQVRWTIPVLEAGASRTFGFQVTVLRGKQVVNDQYGVRCAEGVSDLGDPVVTVVTSRGGDVYMPLVLRNAQ